MKYYIFKIVTYQYYVTRFPYIVYNYLKFNQLKLG